jgi:hypothetical protein
MKYDIQPYETDKKCKGFYVWNKPTFFIKKDDERYERYVEFKKEHGFSPDETWDLKTNIAVFIVPRLKEFKSDVENLGAHPGCFNSNEEWLTVLDKMIFAFESEFKDDFYIPDEYLKKYMNDKYDSEGRKSAEDAYWNDIQEGRKLFAEYFGCLWW